MNRPKFLKSLEFKYLLIVILPIAAMFHTQVVNFAALAFGEQVLLETFPVDPRDILRGDYVNLGYNISFIDVDMLKDALGDMNEDFYYRARNRNREIFVALQKDEQGIGSVKSVSATRPTDGLYLRGVIRDRWNGVGYGIGVYYVPEGTGREIEDRIRGMDKTIILVDVRVLRGRPVIKDLVEFEEIVLKSAPMDGSPE
ncbi:MAG: GDYXXLXY domain-containing protein [Synergistaceae bacterium]|nr:GDYXXLXY domain-containing protein [Synergistaceae bacterium]